MKPEIQSPMVTAYALGELPSHEENLLRMTFAHPVSTEALTTEVAEVRTISHSLRTALKAEAPALSLTAEQREEILQRTASRQPVGRRPGAAARNEPLSMARILEERKAFDRKPARTATYWTLGAAAAIIGLLAIVRPKSDPQDITTRQTAPGTAAQGPDLETGNFKVVPPKTEVTDATQEARKNFDRNKIGTLPPSIARPFDRDSSSNVVVQGNNATLPGAKPKTTEIPELPKKVTLPPPAPGSESDGTYASPGPAPVPPKKR